MKTNAITVGTAVAFDSDHGPQEGTVQSFKSDLGNGQRVAAIDVPGTLDGEPWHVPVAHLKPAGVAA